ncbi:hypothetical protein [Thiomicrorhabdus aquaedulcis]|uniref:hypothetical protein n=1 Tax=Thiomicrorhabdus aquaedulcis TaxID=2211106 RepID=UPI001E658778|nr:hypothetical protein [Thiomicrorhabdus aquaedulcis]
MEGTLDIQRDHVGLIEQTLKLLNPGGELVFSNNLRKFKLEAEAFADWDITNITQQTMPKDYERNSKIHQAWVFKKHTGAALAAPDLQAQ